MRTVYNYFRDYDPSIGRYVTSDPIGLDGGINIYTYTEGNPLYLIDPIGLSATCIECKERCYEQFKDSEHLALDSCNSIEKLCKKTVIPRARQACQYLKISCQWSKGAANKAALEVCIGGCTCDEPVCR